MNPFELIKRGATGILNQGKSFLKDQNAGGIIKNTVTGIPRAAVDLYKPFVKETYQAVKGTPTIAKEFVAPSRGYGIETYGDTLTKQLTDEYAGKVPNKGVQPTFKQTAAAPFKVAAEISSDLGGILGNLGIVQGAANTRVGNSLADLGLSILEFGKPKNAQEAKAMRLTDIAGLMPVGATSRSLRVASEVIAGTKDTKVILNTLRNEIPQLTDKEAKGFASIFSQVDDVTAVESQLNKIKMQVNKPKVEPFEGFSDLSTTIVEKLKGRTTVSKQFISDLTNGGDVKQVERETIREVLERFPDKDIPVKEFADKVKAELLPLKTTGQVNPRYENVSLPEDVRGGVANYSERVYESPVKTSAGDVHFSSYGSSSKRAGTDSAPNYFGHTRVEDMKDGTRRVIEVQSDLYQKGRLAQEGAQAREIKSNPTYAPENKKNFNNPEAHDMINKQADERLRDVARLEQYNDPTAHFRMVREEIKQAAKDGKTKLQFPTGETAMKIEGLGTESTWVNANDYRLITRDRMSRQAAADHFGLRPEDLKVGKDIKQFGDENNTWIITDVLGDGKFKAVPKDKVTRENAMNGLEDFKETFDISGKIDTNNPIYKFYEKEMGKYLKNKYAAQLVTDSKGVTWYEIPVKKELKDSPVAAFNRLLDGKAGKRNIKTNGTNNTREARIYEETGRSGRDNTQGGSGLLWYGGGIKRLYHSREIGRRIDQILGGSHPKGEAKNRILVAIKEEFNSLLLEEQRELLIDTSDRLRGKIGKDYSPQEYVNDLMEILESGTLPKATANTFRETFSKLPEHIQRDFSGISYPMDEDLRTAIGGVEMDSKWRLLVNPEFYKLKRGDYSQGFIVGHEVNGHVYYTYLNIDEQVKINRSIDELSRSHPSLMSAAVSPDAPQGVKQFFEGYGMGTAKQIYQRIESEYGPAIAEKILIDARVLFKDTDGELIFGNHITNDVTNNVEFFRTIKERVSAQLKKEGYPITGGLRELLENGRSYIHNEIFAKLITHVQREQYIPDTVMNQEVFKRIERALDHDFRGTVPGSGVSNVLFQKITPVDQAIARGDIRVVQRNGKEVYQYKKGDTWVTAKTDADALEAVKPLKYSREGIPLALTKRQKEVRYNSQVDYPSEIGRSETIQTSDGSTTSIGSKGLSPRSQLANLQKQNRNNTPARLKSDSQLKSSLQNTIQQPIENSNDANAYFDEYSQTLEEINNRSFFPKQRQEVQSISQTLDLINKSPKYKDISVLKMQGRDIYRNTEQVFGKDFPVIKKSILDPFDESKGRYIDFMEDGARELEEAVVKKLGIKKDTKESALVQQYGERLITKADVIKEVGIEKAEKIVEADRWFRNKYDDLIDQVNEVRKQIYPGSLDKIVPKRKDYYRHFQEMRGDFSNLANILQNSQQIDPTLAGLSPFTKPKSKWASFMQARTGVKTKEDAVGGFLNYLPSASHSIHIDPNIGKFRELGKILAEQTKNTRNINNYINSLHKFANDLAGKTNELDRIVTDIIPGGRKTLAVLNWVNARVKANMILGNVGSSISQIFNVPQGIASAGIINSSKGASKSISQVVLSNPEMAKSVFLKERYFKGFNRFDKGILQNTKKFTVWMVGIFDEIGTKFIWNSQYSKAVAEGVKDPVKYADDATRKLVAGRGIGERPLIQKSKVFQLAAPFQLEVGNLWWVMEDILKGDKNKTQKIVQIATLFASLYALNEASERIMGRRVAFDPIDAMLSVISSVSNDPSIEGLLKAGGRLSGEVLSNVPFGQTVAAAYPEYGFRFGGTDPLTRKELFGDEDPTRFGGGLLAVKAVQDPLSKLLLPFGGNQVKKTYEGIKSLKEGGSYSRDGDLKFEQGNSPAAKVQSILFGKYSTKEARESFEEVKLEPDLKKAKKEDAELKATLNTEARTLYNQIKDLPVEEKKARLLEAAKENPAIVDKVKTLFEEAKYNLTPQEKQIKGLGVANGAKARYVVSKLQEMETADEKKAYLKDLRSRKIISDEVLEQIKEIATAGKATQ